MTYERFWAKAEPLATSLSASHPIWAHSLDVAATLAALLDANRVLWDRMAGALGCGPTETMRIAVWLAALHDIGKFSAAFQSLAPEAWPEEALGETVPGFASGDRPRHDLLGLWLWENGLSGTLTGRAWPGAGETLDKLAAAAFGHHGKPLSHQDLERVRARKDIGEASQAAAQAFAEAITDLLLPEALTATAPRAGQPAVFLLAGLVNLADWIGSNKGWFPYHSDEASPADYWRLARERAGAAVRKAGLVPPEPASELSFTALTGIADPDAEPSPAQRWAMDVALPESPMLVCLEDLTGGGKTEAAHILAARRIAQGRASGVYWAMPTQATANAMWTRQGSMVNGLFAPGSQPSIVLAHGQAGLHEGYLASIGRRENAYDGETYGDGQGDETASSSAASWLAEDRRRAFLADVGAGTVDQALLGVLPTRFYPLRLLGLAGKILVLDEVHSFDAYVTAEIERLIEFQLRLGGDVVLLSATLAASVREKFVRVAEAALRPQSPPRKGRKRPGDPQPVQSAPFCAAPDAPYPLGTLVASGTIAEKTLCPSKRVARRVPVRLIGSVEAGLNAASDAAAKGAACCYIRNTVDDAREAWEALRAVGIEATLFHARFAQCDRQRIETDVLATFGKNGTAEARRGRVLVATQVVEQSLDLDFDVLVSDLAPVDSLIQRMGRFRRHAEKRDLERPPGLGPTMLVVSPEPAAEAPQDWLHAVSKRMGAVYQDHGVLWRTARALAAAGAVDTGAGAAKAVQVRSLMASVYGCREVPEGLARATTQAIGSEKSAAAIADQFLHKFSNGYSGEHFSMHEDHATPTRLGEPTTTVRLALVGEDGELRPWHAGDVSEAQAWALSEVRVASRLVPTGSEPAESWTAAAEAVVATWPKYERDKVLAVLESSDSVGKWTARLEPPEGFPRNLIYSSRKGVSVSQ